MTNMIANHLRITNFLEGKPGYGILIFRSYGNPYSEWTIAVNEPFVDEPDRYHVHVDEDTDFDTALDIVERYISDKIHGRVK